MYWKGSPHFKAFILDKSLRIFPFNLGVVAFVYGLCFFGKVGIDCPVGHLIALYFLGHALYRFIKELIAVRNLVYEVSEQGIVIRKGKHGHHTKQISRDNIKGINIKRRYADRKFGTYTLEIYAGDLQQENDHERQKFDDLMHISGYDQVRAILKI